MAESRPFDETMATGGDAPSSLRASLSVELAEARQKSSRDAPKKLGEYFVLERIGSGAMGSVWACYDPNLDRKVAVKLLHADRSDPKAHVRLVAEARALARLSHPNVVTVHEVGKVDSGTHAGASFVVMEFVEGVDLEGWLEQERTWQAILQAFVAAGEGLWAAHQAGIVHRDFKPANVLVSNAGAIKVADFGLARANSADSPTLDGNAYATQGVAGTPVYMAPEQFVGGSITPAADQYAFCVSLYQALTKNLPHDGNSVVEIMEAKFSEAPTIKDPRDGPKGIGAILTQGLSTEPEARFPDMGAVLERLRALLAPPSRAAWWGVAAAAVVGVVATAAIVSRPDPVATPSTPPETCTGFETAFEEVWSDARRAEIDAAFAASSIPGAAGSAPHVLDALDQWRERHIETRTLICRQAENKTISDEVHEARVACLGYRLALFDTTVALLADADDVVVENSGPLVEGLSPAATCASINPVLEGVTRTRDPVALAKGDAAMAEVSQAYVYVRAGKVEQAKQRIDQLEPLLDELDDPKARAEIARAVARHRDGPRQVELLTQASADAVRARDLQLVAWSFLDLGNAHRSLREFDRASQMYEFAEAAGDRFWAYQEKWRVEHKAEGARVLAATAQGRGDLEQQRGNPLASLPYQARAIEILTPYADQLPVRLLGARNNIAEVLRGLGRYAEARPMYDSAISMAVEHLGDDHPSTITTLQNRGGYFIEAGRPDLGEADLRAARRRAEKSISGEAFSKGLIAFNLSVTDLLHGDVESAKAEIEQAGVQWETTLPPVHPFRPFREIYVGTLERASGQATRALEIQDRAYTSLEAMVGPGHPLAGTAKIELSLSAAATGDGTRALAEANAAIASLGQSGSLAGQTGATAWMAKGHAHRLLGQQQEAHKALDVGVWLLERATGPQHSGLAELLIERALVAIELGHADQARVDLERGTALAESFDLDPALITRALLAQASLASSSGGRDELLARARAALELVEGEPSELRQRLAQLEK